MPNDEIYYKECLEQLLLGLGIEKKSEFMTRCTPVNCFKLGQHYYKMAIELWSELRDLKNDLHP